MKKSFKIIALTAVLAVVMLFSLSGCSQTRYDIYLANNWDENKVEISTYDVKYVINETETKGTLTTKIFRVNKDRKFKVNNEEYVGVNNASYFEYTLEMDNSDKIHSEVLFESYANQNFRPRHSFVTSTVDSKTSTLEIKYTDKEATLTSVVNGETTTVTTNVNKAVIYDNAQMIAMGRTLYFGQNGQLSFKVPSFHPENDKFELENGALGIISQTKANVKTEEQTEPEDKTFIKVNSGNVFEFGIAIATKNTVPAGLPISLTIAKGNVTFDGQKNSSGNDILYNQPIIRITEGNSKFYTFDAIVTNLQKVDFNEADFN